MFGRLRPKNPNNSNFAVAIEKVSRGYIVMYSEIPQEPQGFDPNYGIQPVAYPQEEKAVFENADEAIEFVRGLLKSDLT